MNESEVTGMAETERKAAEGMRAENRDHALARLDEKEIRERMNRAFDAFIQQGFEVHLVGVASRGAIEYSLLLSEDGADDVPVRDIQQIADDHRLDVFVQRGIGLRLYPRW